MEQIKKQIEHLELMIMIYSDRDHVRVKQLQEHLNVLNKLLLDMMVA